MTEVKMKTKLPSKKKDETMTLSKAASSSATALRIASSYLKHMKAAAEEQRLRTSRWVDTQGSRTVRRVLNKGEVIVYELFEPKKENLDGNQVRLMGCGILCFSWFPWPVCPPPGFFCFFADVAPNPRILCIRICGE